MGSGNQMEDKNRTGRRAALGVIAAGILGGGYAGIKSGYLGKAIERYILIPITNSYVWKKERESTHITPRLENNRLTVNCVYITNPKNKAYIIPYRGDTEGIAHEIPRKGLPLEGILSQGEKFKLFIRTENGSVFGRERWYLWEKDGGLRWSERDISKDGYLDELDGFHGF